jgi:hypothetical protein
VYKQYAEQNNYFDFNKVVASLGFCPGTIGLRTNTLCLRHGALKQQSTCFIYDQYYNSNNLVVHSLLVPVDHVPCLHTSNSMFWSFLLWHVATMLKSHQEEF